MARRDAVFSGYPLGFEERVLGKTHQNWVERSGLEASFAAQVVTIAPGGGAFDKAFEYTKCLRRYSWSLHARKSTYIDVLGSSPNHKASDAVDWSNYCETVTGKVFVLVTRTPPYPRVSQGCSNFPSVRNAIEERQELRYLKRESTWECTCL